MPKSLAFARLRAETRAAACAVPHGRVTTYGDIARHLEISARHVAWVFAQGTADLPCPIPWHRVVSAGGFLRIRNAADRNHQRELLEAEGIEFTPEGNIADFEVRCFRWRRRPQRFGVGRGPYSDPATKPLFPKSLRLGYPLA